MKPCAMNPRQSHVLAGACYDRGNSFGVKWSLNDGAPQEDLKKKIKKILNPKSSEMHHFFCMILVVHLGHGMFHSVEVLFGSNSIFGGGPILRKSGTSEKKWCTSIVARASHAVICGHMRSRAVICGHIPWHRAMQS